VTDFRFRLNDELTAAKVFDDEAIVINVVTGRYYNLEGTGAVAWTLFSAGASAQEVADALAQGFEVDPATARRDADALLDRLLSEELLLPDPDAETPASAEPPADGRPPYTAPALTAYADMEDLLTVDPPLPAAYTPRP
jgi:hypothetical protein